MLSKERQEQKNSTKAVDPVIVPHTAGPWKRGVDLSDHPSVPSHASVLYTKTSSTNAEMVADCSVAKRSEDLARAVEAVPRIYKLADTLSEQNTIDRDTVAIVKKLIALYETAYINEHLRLNIASGKTCLLDYCDDDKEDYVVDTSTTPHPDKNAYAIAQAYTVLDKAQSVLTENTDGNYEKIDDESYNEFCTFIDKLRSRQTLETI